MPGLDGTGPWGEGPMTGGRRGFCNPAWRAIRRQCFRGWYRKARRWFGFGPGYGSRGRFMAYAPGWAGWCWDAPYEMSPSEEAQFLKAQAESLKRALDDVTSRIEELEGKVQTQR